MLGRVAEDAVEGPRGFPDTRWSLILAARERPEARRAALAELIRPRWRPLYLFARRRGLGHEPAADAVQGFFTHFVEHDVLAKLDPSRGRLRGFLKTAFGNFLVNQHEKDAAARRGGGLAEARVDDLVDLLAAAPTDPALAFDREWALGIVEESLAALALEFARGDRGGPFALVRTFFGFEGEPPAYADAAAAHGMTVPQLKSFLHRARVRFRELVRARVADTVGGGDVDAEMADLFALLVGR